MTDDEIALWLITKGTMEDKPIMAFAAEAERDRLETALVYAKDYLDLGMEKMAFNVIRHALRRRSHE